MINITGEDLPEYALNGLQAMVETMLHGPAVTNSSSLNSRRILSHAVHSVKENLLPIWDFDGQTDSW